KPNDLAVVLSPLFKHKRQHLTTYINGHDPNFNKDADPNIVLVHKPFNMKLRKFYSLINRLNRTRGRNIRNSVKPLPIYPVRKHIELISRQRNYCREWPGIATIENISSFIPFSTDDHNSSPSSSSSPRTADCSCSRYCCSLCSK